MRTLIATTICWSFIAACSGGGPHDTGTQGEKPHKGYAGYQQQSLLSMPLPVLVGGQATLSPGMPSYVDVDRALSPFSALKLDLKNLQAHPVSFRIRLGSARSHKEVVSRVLELPGHAEAEFMLGLDANADFEVVSTELNVARFNEDPGSLTLDLDVDQIGFLLPTPGTRIEVQNIFGLKGVKPANPDEDFPYGFSRGLRGLRKFGVFEMRVSQGALRVQGDIDRRPAILVFPTAKDLSRFESLRVVVHDELGAAGTKVRLLLKEDDAEPGASDFGRGDAWGSELVDLKEGAHSYEFLLDAGRFERSSEPEDQGGNGVFEASRVRFAALVFFSGAFGGGTGRSSVALAIDDFDVAGGLAVTADCGINHGGCDPSVECKNTSEGPECGPCPTGTVLGGRGRCIREVPEPILDLADAARIEGDSAIGTWEVNRDLSRFARFHVRVRNPQDTPARFRVELEPKQSGIHRFAQSREVTLDAHQERAFVFELDSRDFPLWNDRPAVDAEGLVMDLDLARLHVRVFDGAVDVFGFDVSGTSTPAGNDGATFAFERGASGVLAFGAAIDDRGLGIEGGRIRYVTKAVGAGGTPATHGLVFFRLDQNLNHYDAIEIRALEEGAGKNASFSVILKESEASGIAGELGRGDGWVSKKWKLDYKSKSFSIPLNSQTFNQDPDHEGGNGQLELKKVRWIGVLFDGFDPDHPGRTLLVEHLNLVANPLAQAGVLSEEGAPVFSADRSDVLVAYPSGELAIRHLNQGDIARAREILKPAVRAIRLGRGRMPRRYDAAGEPQTTDATNGDSSVMSIALARYVNSVPATDAFRSAAADANVLLQAWLAGRETSQPLSDGSVVRIKSPLLRRGLFRPVREGESGGISTENEVRRAISMWFTAQSSSDRRAGEEEARALLRAIASDVWDPSAAVFRSNVRGEASAEDTHDECARDALSLLVLAADGMGLKDELKDDLLEAAEQPPCYTSSEDQAWFGYTGSGAIPEFMFLDATAMAVLGLDDLARKTEVAAERLSVSIQFGYSTTSPREASAITLIMRGDARAPATNPYFGTTSSL